MVQPTLTLRSASRGWARARSLAPPTITLTGSCMKPHLDFFLFYGSIYTYLAAMRIERVAASAGVDVRWRPFNLREILVEQNNVAFTQNAVRMNYCWRDVERRAARHGLPFVSRPPYPVDAELLALRVGVVAEAEGWCAEYT